MNNLFFSSMRTTTTCIAISLLSGCAYSQHMNAERARADRLNRQLTDTAGSRSLTEQKQYVLIQEKMRIEYELAKNESELQQIEDDYQIELKKIEKAQDESQWIESKFTNLQNYKQKIEAKIAKKKNEIIKKKKKRDQLTGVIY